MATFLMPPARQRGWSNNGAPAAGCLLYTYAAGTSTPKAAYTDPAGLVPHTNPIVLDAKGEALIYWDGNYKIDLRTAAGVQVTGYPVDNFETPLMSGAMAAPGGAGLLGFLYASSYAAGTVGNWLQSLATAAGSTFMGYAQALSGARTRSIQEKIREIPSVTDYSTVIADGSTDQTATIVAWLGTLPPTYDGLLRVPYGCKFDADAVYDALPVRAILIDDSGTNSWDTAGSRARVLCLGAERGDSTSVVDLTTILASSGHNAATGLNNRGTAGSTSGNLRVAAFHWFSGFLKKGQRGLRQLARWEWLGDGAVWVWVMRKFVPWSARNWEYWYASTAYGPGATLLSSNGKTYSTVAGGVSGAVEPNHSSGSAVDGTITWVWLQTSQDSTIFAINENGQLATNSTPLDGVVANLKASTESVSGNASLITEATGVSKIADFRMYPTNASGVVQTALPRLSSEYGLSPGGGAGVRMLPSTALFSHWFASNDYGFQLSTFGLRERIATVNSATPSIDDAGLLIFSNTGATSVTGFTSTALVRCFYAISENTNTTIVHNASTLVLKGGVNAALTAGQIILFMKYSRSGAWYEMSRNF